MNILFNALLISLLLLPGVILRLSYLNIAHGKRTFKTTFAEELFISLILTFFIQFAGYIIVRLLFIPVDEPTLFLLLINSDKTLLHQLNPASIILFFVYCTIAYLVSWFLGALLRTVAMKKFWDVTYPIFRLHNNWYYILRGIIEEDEKGKKYFKRVKNVWVDILVENKEHSLIYSGFLFEFILSKEEGLDRLYLSGVRRRKFTDDKAEGNKKGENDTLPTSEKKTDLEVIYNDKEIAENESITANDEDGRYYYMPGDTFVIPYAQIANINIFYYDEIDSGQHGS